MAISPVSSQPPQPSASPVPVSGALKPHHGHRGGKKAAVQAAPAANPKPDAVEISDAGRAKASAATSPAAVDRDHDGDHK